MKVETKENEEYGLYYFLEMLKSLVCLRGLECLLNEEPPCLILVEKET
ncbi:MAG: hypothetical protein ABIN54_10840 [candidate division WOR-3 bacterium]